MQRKSGDGIVSFALPAIDGSIFESDRLKGKRFMLSFFRFASCPFCNLRMHELTTKFKELGGDFTIVAIFDSPLDNLQQHATRHQPPFPVLADEDNVCYKRYGIEYSLAGVLKGMLGRMPTLLNAMFVKGYIPLVIKGRMTTMPADFLVDENGIIKTAYYGKDEGDHLPFHLVRAFAIEQNLSI